VPALKRLLERLPGPPQDRPGSAAHRGGDMSNHDVGGSIMGSQTRRTLLRRAGGGAIAVLGGTLWRTGAAAATRPPQPPVPIKNVIIACQENRSFDHYFGYAPQVQAAGYGPPAGYFQPDSAGGKHFTFEFTALSTPDPPHGWNAVHDQWDGGK